jgi:hypothetical protein
MKRLLSLTLCILLLLAMAAGCAMSATTRAYTEGQATYATTTAGEYGGDKTPGDLTPGSTDAVVRKVIRNASLDLEVKDVPSAYNQLLAFAAQYGGYEAARLQSRSNGYITIDAQIKIKPGQLDAFLEYAATLGEVINTQTTSSDITENYFDAQTRLSTMERTLETYYDFLANAANIDESLKVQARIDSLTVEIESLKGQLKLWDSLLAESVITLRLRQVEDPVKIKKEISWSTLSFGDMLYLMRSGLTGVLNFLVNAVQWLAVALVVTLPFWLIGLIVLILVRRKRKKTQRLAQAAQLAKQQEARGEARLAGGPSDDDAPHSQDER